MKKFNEPKSLYFSVSRNLIKLHQINTSNTFHFLCNFGTFFELSIFKSWFFFNFLLFCFYDIQRNFKFKSFLWRLVLYGAHIESMLVKRWDIKILIYLFVLICWFFIYHFGKQYLLKFFDYNKKLIEVTVNSINVT